MAAPARRVVQIPLMRATHVKFHSNMYGWEYVWREFADELGGKIQEAPPGRKESIAQLTIEVPERPWTITFIPFQPRGRSNKPGTVALVPYKPEDAFAFAVYTEKWRARAKKILLGMQDLQIGDEAFDTRFIVQGNDKANIVDIFADFDLRDLMLMQPDLVLRTVGPGARRHPTWEVPEGHNVLEYTQEERVEDFGHLKAIHDLLVRILDQMCAVGATTSPHVEKLPPTKVRSGFFKI